MLIALMIFPPTKPGRVLFSPQNPKGSYSQVLNINHSRKYINIAF